MEESSARLVAFTWIDYSLFSLLLILSAAIGIYFGCFGSKQKSKNDYLLGGKTMKVIPIAISLIASDISGVALMAIPADIYRYGAYYLWTCCSISIVGVATSYVYIPVFHKLQLTSTYEYLKLRFDSKVRLFASLLFTLSILLYNPIVIYIPALALAQATGISVHLISPIVCATCVFYTALGGLKAVVWTDTIQMALMVCVMALIFYLGISTGGGISNIIDITTRGQRLDILGLNIDPTIRDGICAIFIGSAANGLGFVSVSQSVVQRFMAVPTLTDARKVAAIFFSGIFIVKLTVVFSGLIMYAKYANCDPLTSGIVKRTDQILPYYIMDVAGRIPGLPGLFIAGIFSASLSTLSGCLNTLAATIFEDFILPFTHNDISERQTNAILRIIVVVAGVTCTVLIPIVETMGGVFPITSSVTAITGGPLLGLFSLGMLVPSANAKGALYGAISGLSFISWVVIGNQWYKRQSYYDDPIKPFSTAGCPYSVNVTTFREYNEPQEHELPFYLYRVTFWYHTIMGAVVTITIGVILSWCDRTDYPPVNPDLLSPVLNIFRSPAKCKKFEGYIASESKPMHCASLDT